MTTHIMCYGTLTTGTPYYRHGSSPGERGWFMRLDTYTSKETGAVDKDPIACLDMEDDTLPAQHTLHGYPDFRDDYDARCSACWVHRHHTLTLHYSNLLATSRQAVAV